MPDSTNLDRNQLIQQIKSIRHQDQQREYDLCQQLKELAIQENDPYALCFANLYTSDALFDLGQIEKSLKIGGKALELQLKNGYYDLILIQSNLLALLYTHLDDEQSAMDHFFRALKLAKINENHMMLSAIYANLGSLYLKQGAYDQASSTFASSYEAFKTAIHNSDNVNTTEEVFQLNSAMLAFYQKDYTQALHIINPLINIALQKKDPTTYTEGLILQGKIYASLGKVEKVIEKIELLCSLSFSTFTPLNCFEANMDLLELCFLSGYLEPVPEIFQNSYQYARTLKLPNKWVTFYDYLIQLSKYTKNESFLEEAYENYYFWSCKQDSFIKHARLTRINNMNALYRARKNKEKTYKVRKELRDMAVKDELTQLANRYGLNQYVKYTFQMAKVEQLPFTVLLLDVDYFKEYNDTYGHLQGDHCLRKLSQILASFTEKTGFAARYGGDEFILIFINKTLEEMERYARTILDAVTKLEIEHSASKASPYVSVTIGGVQCVPSTSSDFLDYIHAADNALYFIKRSTRNNYYFETHC